MMIAVRRPVSLAVLTGLLVSVPGPDLWAQVGRAAAAIRPATPSFHGAAVLAAEPGALTALPQVLAAPALPSAVLPAAAPAASVRPTAAPAAVALPTAREQAGLVLQAASVGEPASSGAAGTAYDGAVKPKDAAAEAAVEAPRDLGLTPDVLEKVGEFTAGLHDRVAGRLRAHDFTIRDFEAWKTFVRFFTPKYGLQEALKRGAEYVYRDRLDKDADRAEFDTILAAELGRLSLPDPKQGLDAAKAQELARLAEPTAEELAPDETSPFRIPVSELVPDKASADLILTNDTLRRMEAAYHAFALRDYMLMVGPPAAVKSALPRYLAAELKVPYLAVNMHPGIGTFELVGGYRPREMKIHGDAEAAAIVREALERLGSTGDAGALIEGGSRVYGPGTVESFRAAAREDLEKMGADPAALRRLVTLAHALRYGESALSWQDGYLTYALKRDLWINFEELNAAPTEVLEFLNEFMRSRRLVISQKLGKTEVLEPRKGGRFMLWATMNPETDSNRNVLANTLKNRWRIKHFGDLPSAEMAEVLERKYGLPPTWALALVENVHKPLSRQARDRVIGGDWRDGYVFNFRHLLRVARRWKAFRDRLPEGERAPESKKSLELLAREALSVYGGPMRKDAEKQAVFTLLDQALRLSANAITAAQAAPRATGFEDLGDRIRILDVELKKGPGGPKVPRRNPDYFPDAGTWTRLYEYAKALSLGEPILLMGESGAGKTTDLEYLFHLLNYNLHYKNLDSDTAHEEVVGGYVSGDRKGSYVFSEGLMPAAMEEGSAVFLDEFNLNPLVEWMNTVVDDGTLYLPHRIVRGRPFLVAAANPPEPSRYGGRLLLSPAVRSRWQEFWVPRDFSKERLKKLMTHWLSGGARLYGRGADGFASWLDAAKDLWSRAASKKKVSGPSEVAPDQAPEGSAGAPATLEELLKKNAVPEAEWPAVRRKVEAVETKMRMVGVSVGRDTSLQFAPGEHWAYFFQTNTITYPLAHLLSHTEEEIIGVIDHEGGHRDITVIDMALPLVRKYMEDPEKHFLWNAIEDPRVNNWVKHRLPGAEHYLHRLYDRYVPESMGPMVKPPTPEEVEQALKGDGATAFDPRVLGLPHVEFAWAINYYWRHGKPPALKIPSARQAFELARPHLDKVFARFPASTDPSYGKRLAYTLDALKTIDEKILPLYEPLVARSKEKLAKSMRKGKGGKSNKGGSGGSGMSPPQSPPPKDGKPQQGKDGKPQPNKEGKSEGNGDKKDGQSGGGDKKEGKKSLRERLLGKDKGGGGEEEDPEPDPKRPRDEFDARADQAVREHAKEAAKNLGQQTPRSSAQRPGPKGPASASSRPAGDEPAKPLTISDVAQTQRDILTNDEATPYQRVYRQVAEASGRLVTHLENIFTKNSRPGETGYYSSGRRPDIKRAMRREGEGSAKDDVWLKRVEATKRTYKVTLLVDESGSMEDKRRYALQAVVMLVDALHRLQIDVEVIGFAESAVVHLPYGRPLGPEEKEALLTRLDESVGRRGATHDADAVKLGLDRILAEDGDLKMIFVVTDGEGNGPSKLSSILPEAAAARIPVFGVGVGEGMSYVATAYERHILVSDYSQLPGELKAQVERYISERELEAGAAARGSYGMGLWSSSRAAPTRFEPPLYTRLLDGFFSDRAFKYWIQLSWIIPVALGLAFQSASVFAGAVVTGGLTAFGFVFWKVHRDAVKRVQGLLHVPAKSNAALFALHQSLPEDVRRRVDAALKNVIAEQEKAAGRKRENLPHPFLVLGSAFAPARSAAWKAVWPELKSNADLSLVAAFYRARSWKAVRETDLSVLSEAGPEGRRLLLELLDEVPASIEASRVLDALVASAGEGVENAEAPRLEEVFRRHGREDGLRRLAAFEEVERLARLTADAELPGTEDALLRRAETALAATGGDFLESRRREAVAQALGAVRAAADDQGAALARARLERLLDDASAPGSALFGRSRPAFAWNPYMAAWGAAALAAGVFALLPLAYQPGFVIAASVVAVAGTWFVRKEGPMAGLIGVIAYLAFASARHGDAVIMPLYPMLAGFQALAATIALMLKYKVPAAGQRRRLRELALSALSAAGPARAAEIRRVYKALSSWDQYARYRGLEGLRKRPLTGAPLYSRALGLLAASDPDELIRYSAAERLADWALDSREAESELRELAAAPDLRVSSLAERVLHELDARPEAVARGREEKILEDLSQAQERPSAARETAARARAWLKNAATGDLTERKRAEEVRRVADRLDEALRADDQPRAALEAARLDRLISPAGAPRG